MATTYKQKKERGRRVRGKAQQLKWEFIAVDGEGSTREDGSSVYQLLAAHGRQGDQSIEDLNGLPTIDCLEFLLSLPYRKEKVCVCGYGFTYDICNILIDVKWEQLKALSQDETIGIYINKTSRYRIRVIYKKAMEIWKLSRNNGRWETIKYVRVYDTIGFFQCSFLSAVEQWKIGDPSELAIVETYKKRRGEDLEGDWEGWKKYNATECRLLVKLMQDFSRVLEAENIRLSNWWGAGAIAAFWYKQQGVKEHLVQSFDQEIDEDINRAYFGGQIQRLKVGIVNQPVYHYDLCSAYPWAQSQLPSLIGEWYETDKFEVGERWALYEIDWDMSSVWDREKSYGPLPYRTKQGSILYPKIGAGVYWSPEVVAVLRHWPHTINVRRGKVFRPICEHLPFHWIGPLFERRNRLKKEGDPRNIPLKLGLNSLYGKTVQKQGMKDSRGRRLTPPYQSYVWGGLITSLTRARIIDAVATNPKSILSVNTDGLFSLEPLPLQLGKDLGDWMQEETLDWFELYGNGVYRGGYRNDKGEERLLLRARGVEEKEFDFDAFARVFKQCNSSSEIGSLGFRYDLRRFYGYKIACHRNNPSLFCSWGEERKIFTIIGIDCFKCFHTSLPNLYRIECTFGQGAKIHPSHQKPRLFSQPFWPQLSSYREQESDFMEAEQP